MNTYEIHELASMLDETRVQLHIVPVGSYGKLPAVGIHLLTPDVPELQDALEVALRDGFPSIYLYSGPILDSAGLYFALVNRVGISEDDLHINGPRELTLFLEGSEV